MERDADAFAPRNSAEVAMNLVQQVELLQRGKGCLSRQGRHALGRIRSSLLIQAVSLLCVVGVTVFLRR